MRVWGVHARVASEKVTFLDVGLANTHDRKATIIITIANIVAIVVTQCQRHLSSALVLLKGGGYISGFGREQVTVNAQTLYAKAMNPAAARKGDRRVTAPTGR